MERLALYRLPVRTDQTVSLGAFSSLLPGNFREIALQPQNLCVGAVFDGKACGIALIELHTRPYLRWVYVDPHARCCGLGTHLLRGLLGEAKHMGSGIGVHCVFTLDMAESGRVPGILERAGFTRPEPVSTEVSAPLGSIRMPKTLPSAADAGAPGDSGGTESSGAPGVLGVSELSGTGRILPLHACPESVRRRYEQDIMTGTLPHYVNIREATHPVPSCCLVAIRDDLPAGVLLCEEQAGCLHVRGLHVREPYRKTGVMPELVAAALTAARSLYGGTTLVTLSAINQASLELCHRLFPADCMKKRTEYHSVYEFSDPSSEQG